MKKVFLLIALITCTHIALAQPLLDKKYSITSSGEYLITFFIDAKKLGSEAYSITISPSFPLGETAARCIKRYRDSEECAQIVYQFQRFQ